MVFQVPVTSTDPMVFYCAQGQHCSRGMHGVVNGAGQRTLASYRSSITIYKNAGIPTRIQGGQAVPNNLANILPSLRQSSAGSSKASLAAVVAAVGLVLVVA
jgi:hypothetical protein